jgi:hypothetical protein
MNKRLVQVCTVLGVVLLFASAAHGTFVRGSLSGAFCLPQMEMPRADAWAKEIDAPEEKIGHDGELGDIGQGLGFAIGYGVTLGGHFRFDANIANFRTENDASFTGDEYDRNLRLTTHIVPVRLGGSFLAPGVLGGRLRAQMGLGFVAFILKYDTYQEITVMGTTVEGHAWTREVCYGPEVRLGAEYEVYGPFAVEGYLTYWTAEATLNNWHQFGDAPERGPTREDLTGWAVWFAPRLYL